jgi:hypothetical protein
MGVHCTDHLRIARFVSCNAFQWTKHTNYLTGLITVMRTACGYRCLPAAAAVVVAAAGELAGNNRSQKAVK